MSEPQENSYRRELSILFRHLSPHRRDVALIIVIGVISSLVFAILPYLLGRFFDALSKNAEPYNLLGHSVPFWALFLFSWAALYIAGRLMDFTWKNLSDKLHYVARLDYEARALIHLIRLPLAYHHSMRSGKVSELVSVAGWRFAGMITNVFGDIAPEVLRLISALVITAILAPVIAVILVCVIAIYGIMLVAHARSSRGLSERGQVMWSKMYGDNTQAISNIATVKYMAMEDVESAAINERAAETSSIWTEIDRKENQIQFFQNILTVIAQAVVLFVSVLLYSRGSITLGTIIAINTYVGMLFAPLTSIGKNFPLMQTGLIKMRMVEDEIFNVPTEVYHPEGAYAPGAIDGNVSFDHVAYSYDGITPVLKDISFTVSAGEKVALVGKSGAGKSTTIDLISGYHLATGGAVMIDGHDVRTFDLTALRKLIAIVPQEPVLFNDTVMMNIRYARPEATDDEVIAAAKEAQAHDFITAFPDGYNALAGERGVKLSVGQKQRIAIARAILRNPKILILDEPTSALDAETEHYIAAAFEKLMEGRTTFIVAHRLSTVRRADRIFVFNDGKITEEGTHDFLISKDGGLYRRLHELSGVIH